MLHKNLDESFFRGHLVDWFQLLAVSILPVVLLTILNYLEPSSRPSKIGAQLCAILPKHVCSVPNEKK